MKGGYEGRDTFTVPREGASGRSYLPRENRPSDRVGVNHLSVTAGALPLSDLGSMAVYRTACLWLGSALARSFDVHWPI